MKALVLAAILIVIWPLSFPLAKLALHYYSPEGWLAFRLAFAALIMLAYVAIMRYPLPRRAHLPRFFACGMLGVFGFIYFINLASKTSIPAGEVSFLVAINPLYLVVHSVCTGRHPVTRSLIIGSLFSVIGLAMITLSHGGLHWDIGMLWAILSGMSFAANVVVQKPLFHRYPLPMIGAWTTMLAAIAALPLLIIHRHEMYMGMPWQPVVLVAFSAVVSTCIAFILWTWLVKHLTQVQAGGVAYFLPFSASLSSIPILGEHMSPIAWTGGALIVLGSIVTHRRKRQL